MIVGNLEHFIFYDFAFILYTYMYVYFLILKHCVDSWKYYISFNLSQQIIVKFFALVFRIDIKLVFKLLFRIFIGTKNSFSLIVSVQFSYGCFSWDLFWLSARKKLYTKSAAHTQNCRRVGTQKRRTESLDEAYAGGWEQSNSQLPLERFQAHTHSHRDAASTTTITTTIPTTTTTTTDGCKLRCSLLI